MEVELYGKRESIRYYYVDLLWGQKLYQGLRFVLVEMNGIQSILVSEATLMHYFRKYFFRLLGQKPESCITQIIQELQEESEEHWDFLSS